MSAWDPWWVHGDVLELARQAILWTFPLLANPAFADPAHPFVVQAREKMNAALSAMEPKA